MDGSLMCFKISTLLPQCNRLMIVIFLLTLLLNVIQFLLNINCLYLEWGFCCFVAYHISISMHKERCTRKIYYLRLKVNRTVICIQMNRLKCWFIVGQQNELSRKIWTERDRQCKHSSFQLIFSYYFAVFCCDSRPR